ncbi:unnamed protein product [Rotaria magnacalcarata]|uniref:Uncharacterized protein n=1 Tax=Rotaria magnacalcarata TaxID=392030 RepID=A0A816CSM7_9BILA|nr:unnamed protein product [Rotaria magnacalcarata]
MNSGILEYDIDGKTFKILNSIERLSPLIPKFKQQLIFLEEHQKLFKKTDDRSVRYDDSLSSVTPNCETPSDVLQNSQESSMVYMNSSASSIVLVSTNDCVPNEFMHSSRFNQSNVGVAISKPFQDDYKIPSLPNAVIKDIEQDKLEKFGPHCANRQILIDAIVYDLLDNYNLFYPTHKQFDDIGNAIVKYLQLPLTKQNVTIWKDALQTKLKRQRFEHRDNQIVQEFRLKYSRTGSGRPVKRKIGETAERDRYKQMVMISCDDQASHDIQEKSNQLRDLPTMDINAQLNLWKETSFLRRKCIRDKSTADITKDFPGYSNALLIFEEIKILTKVDLNAAIRRQIPILLDKVMDTPMFISDSSPIRLIKTLCRHFGET